VACPALVNSNKLNYAKVHFIWNVCIRTPMKSETVAGPQLVEHCSDVAVCRQFPVKPVSQAPIEDSHFHDHMKLWSMILTN